jgi:hypothetical protein
VFELERGVVVERVMSESRTRRVCCIESIFLV